MEEKDWENRPPARITLEKLDKQEDKICKLKEKNNSFDLTILDMGNKLDNIHNTLSEHIKQQKDDFKTLGSKVDGVLTSIKSDFVSKTEFSPVQKIVYGAVSVILGIFIVGVIGAAVYFLAFNHNF
jgi:hypothetical protein